MLSPLLGEMSTDRGVKLIAEIHPLGWISIKTRILDC
jgi:hypothetical protein